MKISDGIDNCSVYGQVVKLSAFQAEVPSSNLGGRIHHFRPPYTPQKYLKTKCV